MNGCDFPSRREPFVREQLFELAAGMSADALEDALHVALTELLE